jgi:hypothetical protein
MLKIQVKDLKKMNSGLAWGLKVVKDSDCGSGTMTELEPEWETERQERPNSIQQRL